MNHRLYVLKACEAFCKSCEKGGCTFKCDRYIKFQSLFSKEMYNQIVVKTNSAKTTKISNEKYKNDKEYREKKNQATKDWNEKHVGYRKWYMQNYKKGISVTIKDWLKLHT